MADAHRQDRPLIAVEPDGRALLAGLADGSLPPAQFSHRSHVQAAWQCLREQPLPQAAQRFADLLRSYVARIGAQDKYHHTLTLAFMHLIDARMRACPGDWTEFASANADLIDDARSLLAEHYSAERLESAAARAGFVAPDRRPLDPC